MWKAEDFNGLTELANRVGQVLLKNGQLLTTAESCTGGGIAYLVTEIAGSSQWFDRAFITYSNSAKQQMLGVTTHTLEKQGAVSEATASEMVQGALSNSDAQVALSVSGVAGPTGGSQEKPVGMVCFAWGLQNQAVVTRTEYFSGDRHQIRVQTIQAAFNGLLRETR